LIGMSLVLHNYRFLCRYKKAFHVFVKQNIINHQKVLHFSYKSDTCNFGGSAYWIDA